MFLDFLISGKVTERQNTSKMILGGPSCPPTDPWLSTVPPTNTMKHNTNSENGKWKPGNLKVCKEAHRKIIEIGLVEILST